MTQEARTQEGTGQETRRKKTWSTWQNWETSLSSRSHQYKAKNVADLRRVLEIARDSGQSIRMSAGGRGDSYSQSFTGSPLVQNEGGIIVMTPEMKRGWVEDVTGRLTAQPGMRLRELDELAWQHRLVLPTTTAPDTLTVAGAPPTGSHGCGIHGGALADSVVGVKILKADGTIVEIGEDDTELLRAARVDLGSLGIVLEITYQLVPAYKLVATDEAQASLGATVDSIEEQVTGHDYFELFWFPCSDKVWLKKWDRVPLDTPDVGLPSLRRDHARQWAAATAGDLLMKAATRFPSLTPAVAEIQARFAPNQTIIGPPPRIYHYQVYFPRTLHDLSYAIEVGPGYGKWREAFMGLVERTQRYVAKGPYPFNFCVHCRFFHTSTGLLAPAVDFDGTCMFELITYIGSENHAFFEETEEQWLSLGGRPHWGKNYNVDLDFRPIYGKNLERFEEIRSSFDPDGRFLNPFLRHVFGR